MQCSKRGQQGGCFANDTPQGSVRVGAHDTFSLLPAYLLACCCIAALGKEEGLMGIQLATGNCKQDDQDHDVADDPFDSDRELYNDDRLVVEKVARLRLT